MSKRDPVLEELLRLDQKYRDKIPEKRRNELMQYWDEPGYMEEKWEIEANPHLREHNSLKTAMYTFIDTTAWQLPHHNLLPTAIEIFKKQKNVKNAKNQVKFLYKFFYLKTSAYNNEFTNKNITPLFKELYCKKDCHERLLRILHGD